jgi:hypothetical protein
MLDPNKAWSLFMMDPVDFLTAISAIIAFSGGGAWWLRGYILNERVQTSEDRLKLAGEQYNNVQSQLTDLKAQVATQQSTIADLRSSLSPSARVEQLARSNTEIESALTSLVNSTSALGHTLTISGGTYRVMVEPISTIKRST